MFAFQLTSPAISLLLLAAPAAAAKPHRAPGAQPVQRGAQRAETPRAQTTARPGVSRPPRPPNCTGMRAVYPPSAVLDSVAKLVDGKDTNLGNSRTNLTISAWVKTTPKRIIIYGKVEIRENDRGLTVFDPPDKTTFRSDFEHVLYDAGDCEIERHEILSQFTRVGIIATGLLSGSAEGNDRYKLQTFRAVRDGDNDKRQPIQRASCQLGGNGDDAGKAFCNRIWFNSFKVHLKPERTECGDVTVSGGKKLVFPLSHRSGDKEIGGSSRTIRLTGTDGNGGTKVVRTSSGAARLRGKIWLEEMEGDRTTFSRTFSKTILTPADLPDHCEVGNPLSESDFESRQIQAVRDHNWTTYQTTGKIRSLRCRTDSKGKENGRTGCEVSFGSFKVPLRAKSQ